MISSSFLPDWRIFSRVGQHVGDGADLLVRDQDEGVLEDRLHAVRVGHEVGARVAAVELHALDVLGLEGHRARLFDGDHAVLADLVHDLGDQVADLGVGGADGGHLGDLVVALDRLRGALDCVCATVSAALSMPSFICIGLAPLKQRS